MNLAVVAIVATVLLAVANPSLGAGGTQLHSGLGSPSVHMLCVIVLMMPLMVPMGVVL